MKISSTRKTPAFRPITITIKVDTEEERTALLYYTSRPIATSMMERPAAWSPRPKDMDIMRKLLIQLDAHLVDPTPDENC
jgi:hypothetical protein